VLADVAACQRQLACSASIEVRGRARRPADPRRVIAYQRHPDLVADGGRATTRASLARDVAARAGATAAAAGAVVSAAAAAVALPGDGVAAAVLAGTAVLAIAGAVLAYRYRGELHRIFTRLKGD
jgi:hypothetical protein